MFDLVLTLCLFCLSFLFGINRLCLHIFDAGCGCMRHTEKQTIITITHTHIHLHCACTCWRYLRPPTSLQLRHPLSLQPLLHTSGIQNTDNEIIITTYHFPATRIGIHESRTHICTHIHAYTHLYPCICLFAVLSFTY